MSPDLIYFALVVFVAFFVYSFVGFGVGLVGIPLLLIFMEAKVAVPAFTVLVFVNGLFMVRAGRNQIQWMHVRRLLFGAFIGVPIGTLCLKFMPSQAIAVGVNVFIFIFACLYLAGGIRFRLEGDHPIAESAVGFISGIFGGSGGVSGPPIVIYGILRDWQKDMFRSTLLAYFLGLNLWANTSFIFMKMHSAETGRIIMATLIPSLLASWIGTRVKERVDETLFRRIVLAVIISTSLVGAGRYMF